MAETDGTGEALFPDTIGSRQPPGDAENEETEPLISERFVSPASHEEGVAAHVGFLTPGASEADAPPGGQNSASGDALRPQGVDEVDALLGGQNSASGDVLRPQGVDEADPPVGGGEAGQEFSRTCQVGNAGWAEASAVTCQEKQVDGAKDPEPEVIGSTEKQVGGASESEGRAEVSAAICQEKKVDGAKDPEPEVIGSTETQVDGASESEGRAEVSSAICQEKTVDGAKDPEPEVIGATENQQEVAETRVITAPETQPEKPLPELSEEQKAACRTETIFTYCKQQKYPMVYDLLETYPQHWTDVDEDGHTLMHWASLTGNKEFVERGLEKGIPVNSTAKNLQTPLMWAAIRGHISVMRTLLEAGANVVAHDSLGATPLIIAVQHRNYRSVLLLMYRGGARILSDADNNGCTAMHWAAYKGDLKSLQFLAYFGCDFSVIDNSGMSPLHRAAAAIEPSVIEFLIEKGCDPRLRAKDGKSPVDIADEMKSDILRNTFRRVLNKFDTPSKTGQDIEMGGGDKADGGSGTAKMPKEPWWQSMSKDKSAQKAFPVFWLVCVSLATIQYLEVRTVAYEVAAWAAPMFELGVPLSLTLFFMVALGDPGKIPNPLKGRSGVEEIMKSLDGIVEEGKEPDISRLCTTTWVLKDLRTKYCTQTGACVSEFDHYCVWLNTAIGKGNHRTFMMLSLCESFTQLSFIWVCIRVVPELVPYKTFFGFIWSVMTGWPLLTLIFIAQVLTAPWILMLIVQQSRLVMMNLTTNEMMNMHRYEHFWSLAVIDTNRLQKTFVNPFNKGSAVMNCFDFWWLRRRSERVAQPTPCTSPGGQGNRGHVHNGHSHGGQPCHGHH